MKHPKYYVVVTANETRIILNSLIRMKNRLLREGRYAECVDELIVKIAAI